MTFFHFYYNTKQQINNKRQLFAHARPFIKKNGWMAYGFTSFSVVLSVMSGRNAVCNGTSFTTEKISASAEVHSQTRDQ